MGTFRALLLASTTVVCFVLSACPETGPSYTEFPSSGFDIGGDSSVPNDVPPQETGPPDGGVDEGPPSPDSVVVPDVPTPDVPAPDPTPDVPAPDPTPDVPAPDPTPDVPAPDLPVPDADVGPMGPPSTPLTIRENRPHVAVVANGAPEIEFLIDTGSPLTVLDVDHFGGSPGSLTADISTFGTTVNGHSCARYDLFGPLPAGATQLVAGILGSEFFDARVLALDYHNSVGYLFDDYATVAEIPEPTASPVSVGFTLEGGGNFGIPGGGGNFNAGASRIILTGTLEGQQVTMLVDTGAAYTVIKPSLFNSLSQSGRPTLDGVRIIQSGQNLEATMTRASSISLGAATVESTPMVVVTNSIFDALQSETGTNVEMFVGGTWLRHYLTTIDYTTDSLHVAEFSSSDHINPDEWVGPGFRVNDGPGQDFLVYDVFDGTDAAAKGVQVNWRLAEFEGQSTSAWATVEEFRAHLTTLAPGTMASFGFRDPGDIAVINTTTVLIEDLLPAFFP